MLSLFEAHLSVWVWISRLKHRLCVNEESNEQNGHEEKVTAQVENNALQVILGNAEVPHALDE